MCNSTKEKKTQLRMATKATLATDKLPLQHIVGVPVSVENLGI